MNEFRLMSLFKEKLEKSSLPRALRLTALAYADAPYVWGGENLKGTDCSGLICGPLMFNGFDIRVTADRLLKTVFSLPFQGFDPDVFTCVFFTKGGRAGHMGIYVAEDVIMHASGERGVTFDSEEDLVSEYTAKGYEFVVREMDEQKLSDLVGEVSGKDEDLV